MLRLFRSAAAGWSKLPACSCGVGILGLKGIWAEIAKCRVVTNAIIEHLNVAKHGGPCGFMCLVRGSIEALDFETSPEAFRARMVMTVPLTGLYRLSSGYAHIGAMSSPPQKNIMTMPNNSVCRYPRPALCMAMMIKFMPSKGPRVMGCLQ